MLNRVRKTDTIPQGSGETAGLVVDASQNRLVLDLGYGADPSGSAGVAVKRYIPGHAAIEKAANFSVTAKDHGKTFAIDAAATVVATLPTSNAETAGMIVTFVIQDQLPGSGVGHSISPASTDQFQGNGFTPANNKDAVCVVASDRIGDSITVQADGANRWFIIGVTGTWTREA